MKSESRNWKLPVFIAVLVVVALIINIFFFNKGAARRDAKMQELRHEAAVAEAKQSAEELAQEKRNADANRVRDEAQAKAKAEEARKKKAEDAAAEHARFLSRYLNSGFIRKPGMATIGIAIESETGTMNPTIANALAQHLGTGDVQLLNSFFKPEFVADKLVAGIFSGDTEIFNRLELTNSLNGVLIGQQTITYSTNAALENTISAHLRLQVIALPVGLTRESQSWNFAANGIGFRPQEARQAAEDRIVAQIAKSTNMVLAPKF
jgi:hypothetical protein